MPASVYSRVARKREFSTLSLRSAVENGSFFEKCAFINFQNAENCWKKLKNSIHSNHTQGVEFFSIFQRSASRTIRGLFCRAWAFQILFREQPACLVFRVFASLSVSSAEPELVLHEPAVSLSPADVDVVCVAPKKKARARVISGRMRRRVFFVSHAERRDGDRVLRSHEAKINKKKKRCRGRRPWRKSRRASAWQQSAATVLSPFFTTVIRDEWPVSFDYAIVIHSIHSMVKIQFILFNN